MKISNFQYVFIVEGGGWSYYDEVYGITKERDVYKLNISHKRLYDDVINMEEDLECFGPVKISDNVDINYHEDFAGFDAPFITLCEVEEKCLNDLWTVMDFGKNTNLSNIAYQLKKSLNKSDFENQVNSKDGNFVIGEVKGTDVRKLMESLSSSGAPCRTTFHAKF